jgi:hypothetical protein
MQVTNTTNSAAKPAATQGISSSVQAQEQRTRALAREENQTQKSQSEANSQQRFDVNEEAIALVEREQSQSYNNGGNQKQSGSDYNSRYDSPSSQNQSAVAAYQSVDNIAQRDNVQQVFGVDLFA